MKRIAISTLLLATIVWPAAAAAQDSAGDKWKVTVAPYLMGAAMSGTTGIAGQEATIDASAQDIFSHLQFGAMGVVAARKGNWGFGADLLWMALGVTTDKPPANVDPNQGAFAFYGLRRLSPNAELTFGARWDVMQGKITFKGPAGTVLEQTKQWVDPIVGLNLATNGQGRMHARLYSEIGGFNAGSKFSWQVFPTVGFDLGRVVALDFGYRWIGIDYDKGDGLSRFKYDVLTQGPVGGFVFRF